MRAMRAVPATDTPTRLLHAFARILDIARGCGQDEKDRQNTGRRKASEQVCDD